MCVRIMEERAFPRYPPPPFHTHTRSGDSSAEFRLASFFPAPATPAVDAVAGAWDRIRAVVGPKTAGEGAAPAGDGGGPLAAKVDDAAAARRR